MGRWMADLTGAEPIIRDMPVKNDTYVAGELLCVGVTDGTDKGILISGDYPTGGSKVFAGLCNEPVTTDGTIAAYNIDVAKVIVNPFMVMSVEYDISAGIAVSGFATNTIAFACSSGIGHPNAGGGWVYRVVDPGAGELNMIKSSSVTTTTCSLVLADTPTTAPTTSSTFVIIAPVGQYGMAFTATKVDANAIDSGYTTLSSAYGLGATVLANWIQAANVPLQELRWGDPRTHVGKTGIDDYSPAFYAEICLVRSSMYVADSAI